MDKTKKMIRVLVATLLLCFALPLNAQQVKQIKFFGKSFVGNDSIALHVKLLDESGRAIRGLSPDEMRSNLKLFEDDRDHRIPPESISVRPVGQSSGQRIGEDFTFLILIDLNIPDKPMIFNAVSELVKSAPKGCVYISFFGDEVSKSELITTDNLEAMRAKFDASSSGKCFYSAMYAKLTEFNPAATETTGLKLQSGYVKNADIAQRASQNVGKNYLFVFADGSTEADFEAEQVIGEYTLGGQLLSNYQKTGPASTPMVYAFYYTGAGENEEMREDLKDVTNPIVDGVIISDRVGKFFPSADMNQALSEFKQTVDDAAYDYDIIYAVRQNKVYSGQQVHFFVSWQDSEIGSGTMTIGSNENPFPAEQLTAGDVVMKYLISLFVALLTFAFFFIVVKIVIPMAKSKLFAMKYYKPYVPSRDGVRRIICRYCAQDILPGQKVVQKCDHLMHVHCWQENKYHCTDYLQSCHTGVQPRVDWDKMFTRESMRDVNQTLAGILAALVGWVVYEITGRGSVFTSLASKIAGTSLVPSHALWADSVSTISSFLSIGLLLGFFLSLIFRYNDEYHQKEVKTMLKIVGLSVLSAMIGMVAFAIGGLIFSFWVSKLGGLVIPWYCSLPAYLLFSVCFAMSLSILSSIPVKNALLGGVVAAIIGFIVLMFSGMSSAQSPWMTMLLNFIIFGGGLGASIAIVRMMAEKYFLIIQNGVKKGTKIPIHKWMGATGGGKTITIGIIADCEIQMKWETSNKVAKEHAQLYVNHTLERAVIKPLEAGVVYNSRTMLTQNSEHILNSGDTFQIGDTIFVYLEED